MRLRRNLNPHKFKLAILATIYAADAMMIAACYIVHQRRHSRENREDMDTATSPPSTAKKATRGQLRWTESMDKAVIELLVDQVVLGNKIDKGFKSKAYAYVARDLSARFRKDIRPIHIQNRMRTIKKQYMILKAIVNHNGFGWDPIMKVISADEQVWKEYLETHPDAEPYKGKTIDLYEEMCVVVGNDQPRTSMARSAIGIDTKDPVVIMRDCLEMSIHLDTEGAFEGMWTSSSAEREVICAKTSPRQGKKSHATDDLVEMMTSVSSNLEKITKALLPDMDHVSASDLYTQVSLLGGYSNVEIDKLFDILIGDEKLQKSFIGRPEESRHRMAESLLHP
ncbi:uncharacterized protein LOC143879591 [Tasmannia lanceolata]|uniref:uncharacterized protein LOC143879591 n=1 Tax=Tasmannia lanceolata TaxID=3420 RepID=UPI004063C878